MYCYQIKYIDEIICVNNLSADGGEKNGFSPGIVSNLRMMTSVIFFSVCLGIFGRCYDADMIVSTSALLNYCLEAYFEWICIDSETDDIRAHRLTQ